MNQINFSLTKEQFIALRKLVYLGDWMLEAHRDGVSEMYTAEEEVQQMIYANSEEGVAEFAEEFNLFFPTREFEDELQPIIDEYDQNTFWEELGSQLADRDAKLEDTYPTLGIMDQISRQNEYMEFYAQEFLKNGLKNLKIR